MRPILPLLVLALVVLAGCTRSVESPRPAEAAAAPSRATSPPLPRALLAEPVASPAGDGSAQPGLAVDARGRVLLSWLAPLPAGGTAFHFSAWEDGRWGPSRVIVQGQDILANWADTPSLAAASDGTLAAAWPGLQRKGSEGYDVRVALTSDGGDTWGAAFTPHRDGTETEHDFASLVRAPDGTLSVIWLDGRSHASAPHGAGAQALMAATIANDGTLGPEIVLDPRVCDCCATAAVATRSGLLVAYRDRSEDEVRDISVVRHDANGWGVPRAVHADGWKIAGCPVNGPALAADGDQVALAWFSEPESGALVNVTFSSDGGSTFGPVIRIDDGRPLGRVDVTLLADGRALVGWLEMEGEGATATTSFRAKPVTPAGPAGEAILVATMESGRSSGFPRLARSGETVIAAWTAREGETSRVMTALLR